MENPDAKPTASEEQTSKSARQELAETDWAAPVDNVTQDLEKVKIADKVNEEEDAPDVSLSKAHKLIDVEQEIKILEGKPDELISANTWEDLGLNADLLNATRQVMKFNQPSKIQGLAIPIITKGGNFIGQAQSGTGKTAAFSLGVLQRIDKNKKCAQAIILSPTRELCRQNYSVISKLAEPCGISVALLVPDDEKSASGKITSQVVVATPGKSSGAINRRELDVRTLTMFVLDEADEMLNLQGLLQQTTMIHKKLPKGCQVCLFSATYNDAVTNLAKKMVPEPKTSVYVPPEKLTVEKLFQFFLRCNNEQMKFRILNTIYSTFSIGQSIIFCQERKTAQQLFQQMREATFDVSLLHGKDMAPSERDRVMDSFRVGEARVLITTNVLARGIDVLQVSLVINYDLPCLSNGRADCETYLHRVGRSARYGNSGIALNFVDDDKDMQVVNVFENTFNPHKEKGPLIREVKEEQLQELEALLARII